MTTVRGLSSTYISVRSQLRGEGLGMVMEMILGSSVGECGDVRVVSVGEDPHSSASQDVWEQIGRPEDVGRVARPGILGMAIESVHKDDAICIPHESAGVDGESAEQVHLLDQRFLIGLVDLGQAVLPDLSRSVRHGRKTNRWSVEELHQRTADAMLYRQRTRGR